MPVLLLIERDELEIQGGDVGVTQDPSEPYGLKSQRSSSSGFGTRNGNTRAPPHKCTDVRTEGKVFHCKKQRSLFTATIHISAIKYKCAAL